MSDERQLRDRLEALQARRREQEALVSRAPDDLAVQREFEQRVGALNDTRRTAERQRGELQRELDQAAQANARALKAQEQRAQSATSGRVGVVSGLFVSLGAVAAAWLLGSGSGPLVQGVLAATPLAAAAVLSFVRERTIARGSKK